MEGGVMEAIAMACRTARTCALAPVERAACVRVCGVCRGVGEG